MAQSVSVVSQEAALCLPSYGLKVVHWTPLSAFHGRVDTPNRPFEVWLVDPVSADLRRVTGDYVTQQRFWRVQRMVKNLYQERAVKRSQGRVFYVTDALAGRPLEVTPSDVRDAAVHVAALHNALAGLGETLSAHVPGGVERRYGRWKQAFVTGKSRLQSAPEVAPAGSTRQRLWTDWSARWLELTDRSIEGLDRAGYEGLASEAEQSGQVAWNGYRLAEATRLDSGRLGVRQLRDPVRDNQLYDLATLCQEICESGHGEGALEAVEAYRSVRPLSDEARNAVLAFAAYPHLALTAFSGRGANSSTATATPSAHEADGEETWFKRFETNAIRQLNAAQVLLEACES